MNIQTTTLYTTKRVPAGKAPVRARLLLDSHMQSIHDESDCSCQLVHTGSVRSIRSPNTGSGLQL